MKLNSFIYLSINPVTPELIPCNAAWRDFLLGILFLKPLISLIYA
jgi:hypothetical protein